VPLAATARSPAGPWQPIRSKPICGDACDALRHIDHPRDALTTIDGIGAASASKLLARTHPRLRPISNSAGMWGSRHALRTWDASR
jgi:hypothetical protein